MIKTIQRGGAYMNDSDWSVFLIDQREDIDSLPTQHEKKNNAFLCAAGSVAMSADGSIIAMLGNDGMWHIW